MAESSTGERTEKATPKKRKDSREQGQVRKSMEVNTAFCMIVMFGFLKLLGGVVGQGAAQFMRQYLTFDGGLYINSVESASFLLKNATVSFITIMAPVLAVALVAGIAINLLQVGFLFSSKALMPKMSRLNPLKGIKRIFSLRTLYELAKSLLKVTVIGILVYGIIMDHMMDYMASMKTPYQSVVSFMFNTIVDLGLTVGFALLIMSAFDFLYQWWQYEKDLKMTKYEVKMEYKQQEGDPQIKGQIRQKQRQMAMMRMMESVPDADVVITNPTHFAVALKYDDARYSAPVVVAKGQDYLALRIKEVAIEHAVSIVENKPLAQSLYRLCEIGQEIPVDLYKAVAEILAEVLRAKNRIGPRRK